MTGGAVRPPTELAEAVGHRFAAPEILVRALTHPSYMGNENDEPPPNYERLEFLGDRVLGLVIAHLLFERFPESDEGGLATRYNSLVRKEACAKIAERIGLGDYLLLGRSEADAGGRQKMARLGNACEALIAAIYLDGGYPAARRFIETQWTVLVEHVEEPTKDPKTALQEWAQGRGLPTPRYRLVWRVGPDHAPRFAMRVEISELEPAEGEGGSKRAAQQEAAAAFLERQGIAT